MLGIFGKKDQKIGETISSIITEFSGSTELEIFILALGLSKEEGMRFRFCLILESVSAAVFSIHLCIKDIK